MKKHMQKERLKKGNGITLIALVITIIVLLILAGISITMLTGDNSLLKKATDAKEITDIVKIEEQLKLEYLALQAEQIAGTGETATFLKAIENYNIHNPNKTQITSENASGQLKIEKVELSSTNIQIGVDEEDHANVGTVQVNVKTKTDSSTKHYVTVSGNKYEVKETNGDIRIDRTPTTSTSTGITIEAEVVDSTIAKAEVSGTTITITGELKAGSTTLNIKINGTPYTDSTVSIVAKATIKPGGTAVATETDNYTDDNGKTATVPAGFTVSNVKTTTEDETSIDSGLVIKKGSDEYVWIEVPRSIYTVTGTGKTEFNDQDYTNIYTDLRNYCSDLIASTKGWKDEWYDSAGHSYDGTNWYYGNGAKREGYKGNVESIDGCGLTRANYITQYQRMLTSVYKNGGFWIGRYEASGGGTPRSQAGKTPETKIKCYKAQIEAAKVATSDTTNNVDSKNYTSSLLFGIQWDLVCKFLEGSSEWTITESTQASWYINTNSSSWGNYKPDSDSGAIANTGSSATYRKRNIYDFAGNVYEWTLEHAKSQNIAPCSARGGSYMKEGLDSPASYRYADSSDRSNASFVGYRVALY